MSIKNIEVTPDNSSLRKKGIRQWQFLDIIEQNYRDKKLPFLRKCIDQKGDIKDPNFMDDKWWLFDNSSITSIDFKSYFPLPSQYPFSLLMRVFIYEIITQRRNVGSTVFSDSANFMTHMCRHEFMADIFTANRNQPFSTFASLETNDIDNMAQASILRSEKGTRNACGFLHKVTLLQLDEATSAFTNHISTPWGEKNITVRQYVTKLLQTNKISINDGFYPPLPFENVSHVVNYSMPFVTVHFDKLVKFLSELSNLRSKNISQSCVNFRQSASVRDLTIKYKKMFDEFLPIEIVSVDKVRNSKAYTTRYIPTGWFSSLFNLLKSACAWLVLLTSGLRNIDMRHLRIGCCIPSKKHNGIFWLASYIHKTNTAKALPVPETTFKAVKLLELLRWDDSTSTLITNSQTYQNDVTRGGQLARKHEVDMIKSGNTFNNLLKVLPKYFNFSINTILSEDDEATAHCVRATIAGYIAEHSNASILLIKYLFGHTNGEMANRYLRNNPIILRKRAEMREAQITKLSRDIAKDISRGEVGGRKGIMLAKGAGVIRKGIEDSARLENKSLTEMELMTKIEDRLYDLFYNNIKENQTHGLLTPLAVVCMRTTSNGSDSPCSRHENRAKRKNAKVKKAITDALSTLPNPAQCIGVGCSDALISKSVSEPLLNSFRFFMKSKSSDLTPKAIQEEAEAFISAYKEPLEQIFRNRMSEILDE